MEMTRAEMVEALIDWAMKDSNNTQKAINGLLDLFEKTVVRNGHKTLTTKGGALKRPAMSEAMKRSWARRKAKKK